MAVDDDLIDLALGALASEEGLGPDPTDAGGYAQFLRWRRSNPSPQTATAVLGRAVAVAALGPADAPWSALKRAGAALGDQHTVLHTGDAGVGAPPWGWAAREVGLDQPSPEPVHAGRLAAWVNTVAEVVAAEPRIGAVIEAGRGFLSQGRVAGAVLGAAAELAPQICAGEVRLGPCAAGVLRALGLPVHDTDHAGVFRFGDRAPVAIAEARWAGVFAALHGAWAGIQAHACSVGAVRAWRDASRTGPAPEDAMVLRLSDPQPFYAAALVAHPRGLHVVPVSEIHAAQGGAATLHVPGSMLEDGGRPAAILSRRPVQGLAAHAHAAAALADGAEARLRALVARLVQATDGEVAALLGDALVPEEGGDEAALAAALAQGDHADVLAIATRLLAATHAPANRTRAELRLTQARAVLALGRAPEVAPLLAPLAEECGGEPCLLAQAQALLGLGCEALGTDPWPALDAAIGAALSCRDPDSQAVIRLDRGAVASRAGRWALAEAEHLAGLEAGPRSPQLRARLLLEAARDARARGRPDDARQRAREALILALETRDQRLCRDADQLLLATQGAEP